MADTASDALLAVIIIAAFLLLVIGAGLSVWLRLRRRASGRGRGSGWGWWHATAATALTQFAIVTTWIAIGEQVALRSGSALSMTTEYKITPPLDPLPDPSPPSITEHRLGPLLLSRTVEERGIPELGGGSRHEVHTWDIPQMLVISGVLTCIFVALTVPIAALINRRRSLRPQAENSPDHAGLLRHDTPHST